MIKKAYAETSFLPIQSPARPSNTPALKLVSVEGARPSGRYQVRVGNKLFQGDDTRHLLRLAVQARRLKSPGSGPTSSDH